MKYIPYKTVQEISTEYLEKSIKSLEVSEKRLRESLKQVPNLSDEMVENIVKDSLGEEDFIKAQQELSTVYKREKSIKTHFKYVAHVEIILNSEEHKN
jgi:polyhydroxyalkanoate synthesis regulator protein